MRQSCPVLEALSPDAVMVPRSHPQIASGLREAGVGARVLRVPVRGGMAVKCPRSAARACRADRCGTCGEERRPVRHTEKVTVT
ncbi:MAG: hypothetical protein AAB074_21595 [Planctomycetota bacterium]